MKVLSISEFGPKKANPQSDPDGSSLIGNSIASVQCKCVEGKSCEDTLVIPPDTEVVCLIFEGVQVPVTASKSGSLVDALTDALVPTIKYYEGTPRFYDISEADDGTITIKHIGACKLEGFVNAAGETVEAVRLCKLIRCRLYQNWVSLDQVGTIAVGDLEHDFDTTGLTLDDATALLLQDALNADISGDCPDGEVVCANGVFLFNIYAEDPNVPVIKAATEKDNDKPFTYCKQDSEEIFVESEDACVGDDEKKIAVKSVKSKGSSAKKKLAEIRASKAAKAAK